MIAIDTNVLLRIFVNEDGAQNQAKLARQLAEKHKKFYITQIVQVELTWVLESGYKFTKTEILLILDHLHSNEAFILEKPDEFEMALNLYKTVNIEFSDCLIWTECNNQKYKLLTFDKKFSNLTNVMLLK